MSDSAYHQMADDPAAPSGRPGRPAPPPPSSAAPPTNDVKDDAADDGAGGAPLPVAHPVGLSREVKRSPNRLIVDEAHGEGDNSVVMLSLAKMEGQCGQQTGSAAGHGLQLEHGLLTSVLSSVCLLRRAAAVPRRHCPHQGQEEA